MVANGYSSSRTNEATTKKPLTKMEYDDFIAEINSITEHLAKTRATLWETQDKLRASEQKVQQLEMHIGELVSAREKDTLRIKGLQEENSLCLEEEMKIRESMELMKKVFTRTQLKAKEDQNAIALLKEERDLLLEENKKLLEENKNLRIVQMEEKLEEKGSHTELEKSASILATALEQTRAELVESKRKVLASEETIQQLTKAVMEYKTLTEADEKSQQRNTKNKQALHQSQGLERRNDSEDESEILYRAFLDEDLDDGFARTVMRNLDCGALNDTVISKRHDCTPFGGDMNVPSFNFFGFGPRPKTSM